MSKKKDNPNREVRFLAVTESLETRAAGEGQSGPGKITGYAAVYDAETDLRWFREVIRPGAFSRAVTEKQDVRALWNHDTNLILGRTAAGTLVVEDDDKGLRFELDLPDTQAGRDAMTSISRGDITGMSFGFEVVRAVWVEEDKDTELREIHDLNLFEISPVTFPAYADTEVAKRSLNEFQAKRAGNKNSRLMQARRLRMRHHEITRRMETSL